MLASVLFRSSSSTSSLSKQSKSKPAMHQELKPSLDLFIDTKALVVMLRGCLSTGSHINCATRQRFKPLHTFPALGVPPELSVCPVCVFLKDCNLWCNTMGRRSHLFDRCRGSPQIRKKVSGKEADGDQHQFLVTSTNFAITSNSSSDSAAN